MKQRFSKFVVFFALCCMFFVSFGVSAYASDLDSLTSGETSQSTTQPNSNSVADYLGSYTPITDDSMAQASVLISPLQNIVGVGLGLIVAGAALAITVVTGFDLLYIGVPFTRGILGRTYGQQGRQFCLISDEAIACAPQQAPAQGGMSPMSGASPMSAFQQEPPATRSCIATYFKKRVVFLVIFAIALILLTSSIFTDCGINLAKAGFKIMEKINSLIGGFSI